MRIETATQSGLRAVTILLENAELPAEFAWQSRWPIDDWQRGVYRPRPSQLFR
jgi:hypothetical protein